MAHKEMTPTETEAGVSLTHLNMVNCVLVFKLGSACSLLVF